MIRQTLSQMRKQIDESDSIQPASKKKLLALLSDLQSEIQGLSETDRDHAENIIGFAQASTHEAIHKSGKTEPQSSVDRLAESVAGFEETHPRLVETVNSICLALSNLNLLWTG